MAAQHREALFHPRFIEDLAYLIANERKVALRLVELVLAVVREPFTGIGKPEPLKHIGSNVWSRRLTDAHRMVYVVKHDRVEFLQARYHY